jgi:hypothetical protein
MWVRLNLAFGRVGSGNFRWFCRDAALQKFCQRCASECRRVWPKRGWEINLKIGGVMRKQQILRLRLSR